MKLKIGEKIALLRKEKEITQTELADYLFLAPQTISRWEVGSGAPEITLLPKIATFFGVSIDELFGLTSLERCCPEIQLGGWRRAGEGPGSAGSGKDPYVDPAGPGGFSAGP